MRPPQHDPSRLATLEALHAAGRPIVMLTAYDYPSGRVAEEAGVDVVLVGDSAAMTVLGMHSTRDISLDELLMLTRAVRRAVTHVPMFGDLPFGTYEESDVQAVATARRFLMECGCDGVKLEGGGVMLSRVRAIVAAGIPVMGHVGLLPQSVTTADGYRAKGRDVAQALAIVADADALVHAGCMAVVVEAVPSPIAELITRRVTVPVIGIGAGAGTGGQVLVYHDLLGLRDGRVARFVRQYAAGRRDQVEAVRRWAADVRERRYPADTEGYGVSPETVAEVVAKLG